MNLRLTLGAYERVIDPATQATLVVPGSYRAVVLVILLFATLGALENLHEEIIALVPVPVLLSRGLGFGAVTALGMSLGASVVGAAFGKANPFAAGIALKAAQVPLLTDVRIRSGVLVAAVAVWIAWTLFSTSRDDMRPDVRPDVAPGQSDYASGRDLTMVLMLLAPIGVYVWGVLSLDWGFNELTALFLVAGLLVGLVSGLSAGDSAVAFIKGAESMLGAALFVGVARSLSVVLTDGQVIDTIVYGLVSPLSTVSPSVAAILMVPIHALIHIPVVSNSGQAVLTMPIMAPIADLLGISRMAAVMAYQTGAPLIDAITPTNGALMAMLLKANVPFGRWIRFVVPGMLLVALVGVVGVVLLR